MRASGHNPTEYLDDPRTRLGGRHGGHPRRHRLRDRRLIGRAAPGAGDELLGHVHGFGIDPADDTLYIASHHGVYRAERSGGLERVADRWQDTMAFTVVGPGHFLASGHPDLREDLPSHLGLIESTDAAITWRLVSLQGRADFHALDVSGDFLFGYDSASQTLMAT